MVSFQFEAWREGDLQLYAVINGDESSRVPIDTPPIRKEGSSLSSFERIFGDGPLLVSLLVLVCTALGFGSAMLWLREQDDDSSEWEDDEDEENWPEPPEKFPDETPPPIPAGFEDVGEEEE